MSSFLFLSLGVSVSSCITSTLTSPLSLRLGIFDSTVLLMLQVFDSAVFRFFYYILVVSFAFNFCNFRMLALFLLTLPGSQIFFLIPSFYRTKVSVCLNVFVILSK